MPRSQAKRAAQRSGGRTGRRRATQPRPRRVKANKRPALRLQFPATSANLGPGFDAAAVAMKMHLRITASPSREFRLRASGRDAEICAQLSPNLILDTYRDILEKAQRKIIPLKLAIRNRIPIGKGCGSSAAARLAGITLAAHFGKLKWSNTQILEEAARREGHGDNAAACWLGGLAIQAGGNGNEFTAAALPGKSRWPLLLAMPRSGLATEESRQALPMSYDRSDAVQNVQNAMLLLLGWQARRADWLRLAMRDRMHEPYRERLCPLLKVLGALRGEEGFAGVALSGAGPGVLMVLDPAVARWRTLERVRQQLRQRQTGAELIATEVEAHGAEFFWERRQRKGKARRRGKARGEKRKGKGKGSRGKKQGRPA